MKKTALFLVLFMLLSGCAPQTQPTAPPESVPDEQPAKPTEQPTAQQDEPAAQQDEPAPQQDTAPPEESEGDAPIEPEAPEAVTATITMESGGVIVVELYPEIAPQSVYNFVHLAREGFYDGLIFHRVIEGFMIQGGDPTGTGGGGPGYGIKGEFAKNGVENTITHERGVISMARQGDPAFDSAGSQFFIVHEDSTFLDGAYAGFGRVVSGIEVVDEIAACPVGAGDRPKTDIAMKSVTIDGPVLPEPERLSK